MGSSTLPASPLRAQGHLGVAGAWGQRCSGCRGRPCWERGGGVLRGPSPRLGYRITRTKALRFPCARAPGKRRCPPVRSRTRRAHGAAIGVWIPRGGENQPLPLASFPKPWENLGSWLSGSRGQWRQGCESRSKLSNFSNVPPAFVPAAELLAGLASIPLLQSVAVSATAVPGRFAVCSVGSSLAFPIVWK